MINMLRRSFSITLYWKHLLREKCPLTEWISVLSPIQENTFHVVTYHHFLTIQQILTFSKTQQMTSINVDVLSLLLTLSIFPIFFGCFYWWFWTCICLLAVNYFRQKASLWMFDGVLKTPPISWICLYITIKF